MNREQEKRRLRAGAFMVNNGRVLMTINPVSYTHLTLPTIA